MPDSNSFPSESRTGVSVPTAPAFARHSRGLKPLSPGIINSNPRLIQAIDLARNSAPGRGLDIGRRHRATPVPALNHAAAIAIFPAIPAVTPNTPVGDDCINRASLSTASVSNSINSFASASDISIQGFTYRCFRWIWQRRTFHSQSSPPVVIVTRPSRLMRKLFKKY